MAGSGTKARLSALEKEVLAGLALAHGSVWDVGVALAEIEDDALYQSRGYRHFVVYALEVFGLDRTTAYVYRSLAEFPRADVEECGHIKVNLAAQYYRLTPETEDPRAVGRTPFPIEVGGRIVPTLLKDCTTRALKKLIRRIKDDATEQVLPAAVERFVTTMRALMRDEEGFTLDAVVSGGRVRIDRKGVFFDNAWHYAQSLIQALTALGYRPADAPVALPAPGSPLARGVRGGAPSTEPVPPLRSPARGGAAPAARGYPFIRPRVAAPGTERRPRRPPRG